MNPPRLAHAVAMALAVAVTAACGTTVPLSGSVAGQASPVSGAAGGTTSDGGLSPQAADPNSGSTGAPVSTSTGTAGSPSGPGAVAGNRTGTRGRGTAPTGSADPTVGGAAKGAIPAQGRGWTAKEVRIGVTEIKDGTTSAQNAGLRSLGTGDNEAQAHAMADYVNAQGGLFGRKIVIVFDNHANANVSAQPAVESQAVCTKFTQDTPVVAVINTQTGLDTPNLRACLAKARVPLYGVSISPIDDQTLRDSNGLFFPVIVPSWTHFADVFAQRLSALKYFTGWDISKGGPGAAPVKLGAFIHNDPVSERVYKLASAAFARVGHAPVDVFRYSNYNEASNAALQFRADGVTHVFGLDNFFFLFAVQAESQRYRPRYAINTSNASGVLLEANAPAAQNVGALGVGTAPSLDLNHSIGDITPAGKLCRTIMAKHGQTFDNSGLPEAFAFSICDSIRASVEAFTAGGGLDANALIRGFGQAGARFAPGVTFASGLSSTSSVFPGAGLDIGYQRSCSCYNYLNRTPRRF